MLNERFVITLQNEDGDIYEISEYFSNYPTPDEIENFINDNVKKNSLDISLSWNANVQKLYYRREEDGLIKEVKQDLFDVNRDDYVLAHCVSFDFAMGAGIAKNFTKEHEYLKEYCKIQAKIDIDDITVGTALRYEDKKGVVYNLITKTNYWEKAGKHLTQEEYLDNLKDCLIDLKDQMEEMHEDKLAIPRIGAGLDKCDWSEVKKVIKEVFDDTDIEVLVCYID